MPRRLAAVLLSVFLVGASAPRISAATSDAERIRALEERVARLEAHLAALQAQLAAGTSSAPGTIPTPGSERESPARPLPRTFDVSPPPPEPPPVLPAAEADTVSTYATVLEILRALPRDIRPHPKTGWDGLALANANLWLKNHLVGSKIDGRFTVAPTAGSRVARERDGRMVHEHHFTLNFETPQAPFLGVTVQAKPTAGRVVTDSDLYDAYHRVAQSPAQRVTGTIASARLYRLNNTYIFDLTLRDTAVHHPALRP